MTAKEMFEELRWWADDIDGELAYCEYHLNEEGFIEYLSWIVFDSNSETIEFVDVETTAINPCLIQAINKQCEELGWLGETE